MKDEQEKKNIFKKLSKIKNKELILASILIIIIFCVYFTSVFPKKTIKKEQKVDYCDNMQQQIEQLVSSIYGVGKSKIVINWEGSIESVLAYITQNSTNSQNISPQIIQGSNGSQPVVLRKIYPTVKAVAVVCEGGDNISIKIDIINLVSTLLDISPEKIAVYKMKK